MDWPWIVGAIVIVAWFAVFETLAFRHPERINTLSTAVLFGDGVFRPRPQR